MNTSKLKNGLLVSALIFVMGLLVSCGTQTGSSSTYPLPEDEYLFKGLYYKWRYSSIKKFVRERESDRTYDSMLLYQVPLGEPIFWVKPENRTTLFFMEGFRGQVGIGIYRSWLKELHEKHSINIVGPVIGLQGWPFEYRNRQWFFQEDIRTALQIYDAYTSNLPADHRIVLMSQSFGAISNSVIMARGKRKPDASILMAPLNTGLEYRSGGRLVQWLAQRKNLLRHVIPFASRKQNPARASYWDIVNDEKNVEAWESVAKNVMNWEENVNAGYQVEKAAVFMEEKIIPEVKGMNILLMHGDSDLYFSNAGYERLAEIFRKAGNSVDTVLFKDTGHMILFDNKGEEAKKTIVSVLDNRFDFEQGVSR